MNKYLIIFLSVIALGFIAWAIFYRVPNTENQISERDPSGEKIDEEQNIDEDENNSGEEANLSLEEGVYEINTGESRLYWKGERPLGGHTGDVMIKSGELTIENNKLTGGRVVMDMTSIKSDENITRLENHLKSDDFFNVEEYQESSLEITSIEETSIEGEYNATGNLTIKDITEEIDFLIKLTEVDNQPQIISNLIIDRTRWNVNFQSGSIFQNLGDNFIKDEITLDVLLRGEK